MPSKCPKCGAITGADPGKPTTIHQPEGSREKCSGSGKPGQPT